MSELDGVVLTESEIFQTQKGLRDLGLIKSSIIDGRRIVFKLSEAGQEYCLKEIFPNFVLKSPKIEDFSDLFEPIKNSEIPFSQGQSIADIWQVLLAQQTLSERLSLVQVGDEVLSETEKSEVRQNTALMAELLEQQQLTNFAHAQAQAYIQVIMILADAPSSSRKDIAYYLNLFNLLVTPACAAGALAVAILTYLAMK